MKPVDILGFPRVLLFQDKGLFRPVRTRLEQKETKATKGESPDWTGLYRRLAVVRSLEDGYRVRTGDR